ncbi:unnamed protein product [Cylindrotheca closterium]|uniref:Uncharacterized protein n=1 Tax=Cylindrotheca closterium TaxID=2856 RepID=A0AAD2CCZ9_9STRA|nr:unnamed protein product [Cylindrotheca closterium]
MRLVQPASSVAINEEQKQVNIADVLGTKYQLFTDRHKFSDGAQREVMSFDKVEYFHRGGAKLDRESTANLESTTGR